MSQVLRREKVERRIRGADTEIEQWWNEHQNYRVTEAGHIWKPEEAEEQVVIQPTEVHETTAPPISTPQLDVSPAVLVLN